MDIHGKDRKPDISSNESGKSSLFILSSVPAPFIDPVCGMTVEPNTARGGSAIHDGKTYYFCSNSCREKFQADPKHYLSKDGISSELDDSAGAKRQAIDSSTTHHSPLTRLYTCPMHPER